MGRVSFLSSSDVRESTTKAACDSAYPGVCCSPPALTFVLTFMGRVSFLKVVPMFEDQLWSRRDLTLSRRTNLAARLNISPDFHRYGAFRRAN